MVAYLVPLSHQRFTSGSMRGVTDHLRTSGRRCADSSAGLLNHTCKPRSVEGARPDTAAYAVSLYRPAMDTSRTSNALPADLLPAGKVVGFRVAGGVGFTLLGDGALGFLAVVAGGFGLLIGSHVRSSDLTVASEVGGFGWERLICR